MFTSLFGLQRHFPMKMPCSKKRPSGNRFPRPGLFIESENKRAVGPLWDTHGSCALTQSTLSALSIPSAPSRSAAIIIVIKSAKHSFSLVSAQDINIAKTKACCQELSCPRKPLKSEETDLRWSVKLCKCIGPCEMFIYDEETFPFVLPEGS
jgi:hypothetical protein